jgi:hypothetical protein
LIRQSAPPCVDTGFRDPNGRGSRAAPEPIEQTVGVAPQLFQPGNQNPEMSIEQFNQILNRRILRTDARQAAGLPP